MTYHLHMFTFFTQGSNYGDYGGCTIIPSHHSGASSQVSTVSYACSICDCFTFVRLVVGRMGSLFGLHQQGEDRKIGRKQKKIDTEYVSFFKDPRLSFA